MSVDDPWPLPIALHLAIVVLDLVVVILGVCVAVTQRFPLAWVRIARLTASQRSQPVRRGNSLALIGASGLVVQAPLLIPLPHAVGRALFAVALLLALSAVELAWFETSDLDSLRLAHEPYLSMLTAVLAGP